MKSKHGVFVLGVKDVTVAGLVVPNPVEFWNAPFEVTPDKNCPDTVSSVLALKVTFVVKVAGRFDPV